MTLRDDVLTKIEAMDEEKLKTLLSYINIMLSDDLPANYDESHDPSIGFLSGPTDASMRVKEIVADQIEKKFSK